MHLSRAYSPFIHHPVPVNSTLEESYQLYFWYLYTDSNDVDFCVLLCFLHSFEVLLRFTFAIA